MRNGQLTKKKKIKVKDLKKKRKKRITENQSLAKRKMKMVNNLHESSGDKFSQHPQSPFISIALQIPKKKQKLDFMHLNKHTPI